MTRDVCDDVCAVCNGTLSKSMPAQNAGVVAVMHLDLAGAQQLRASGFPCVLLWVSSRILLLPSILRNDAYIATMIAIAVTIANAIFVMNRSCLCHCLCYLQWL